MQCVRLWMANAHGSLSGSIKRMNGKYHETPLEFRSLSRQKQRAVSIDEQPTVSHLARIQRKFSSMITFTNDNRFSLCAQTTRPLKQIWNEYSPPQWPEHNLQFILLLLCHVDPFRHPASDFWWRFYFKCFLPFRVPSTQKRKKIREDRNWVIEYFSHKNAQRVGRKHADDDVEIRVAMGTPCEWIAQTVWWLTIKKHLI